MPRVPKGSPRYQAAVHRTQMAKPGMAEASEQLRKENKVRAISGQAPQTLGGTRKRPPFQR